MTSLRFQGLSESLVECMDGIWVVARENICPADRQSLFSDATYAKLRQNAVGAASLQQLLTVVNPFLDQLRVSHTRLYVEPDPDYYFSKSLFATRDPNHPSASHIGGQFQTSSNGLVLIRVVLDGFPLQAAGLRRGDRILDGDGIPFHPIRSFTGKQVCRLGFERNGRRHSVQIRPVNSGLPETFLAATSNSATILHAGSKRIGYVHLWFGGFNSDVILSNIMWDQFQENVDGLILDLRDGFGAA